jgi:DNA-binding MarR family transcriptional regulator
MSTRRVTQRDFEHLLALRTNLRQFLHWSGEQARAAGLTPAQHQLLLAVQGHPGPSAPTIGELSESLLLRHHSAVSLLDRAEQAGLVERWRDETDRRVTRVHLTDAGVTRLAALSQLHIEELRRLAGTFSEIAAGLATDDG